MRVDVSQVLGQGGFRVRAGNGAFADSLREGDTIRAEVVSSDRSSVLLRAEGGQTFRATPDADVALSPGDKVLLEFSGKEKGLIILSSGGGDSLEETPGQPAPTRGSDDKSLEPYLNKLSELRMPVSGEAARLMRNLIAQNPGLTMEEAAFLASNKIGGDENLLRAALALLSGGEKTDAMAARLLALLSQPGSPSPIGPEANIPGLGSAAELQSSGSMPPAPHPDAPLTDWLTQVGNSAEGGPVQGEQSPDPGMKPIITQNNSNMQSPIVEKFEEITQNSVKITEQHVATPKNTPIPPPIPLAVPEVAQQSAAPPVSMEPLAQASPEPRAPGTETQTQSMGKAIAQLLSDVPEFRGTPASALERFSNMLLRVAGESAAVQDGGKEKLEALIDKLFTRIGKGDNDAGARLKSAREELFARLALIEEAISRAAPPAKAQMLEQTHKLMEHVRVLNSIDQFVYMQLPVQFGQERKAAELYLFKRKGGRKPDPENVNILLALDLENMGRWESLINIRSKDVSIQMEVQGEAEKKHFSANTVLLHELLAEAGFRLVSTDVACSSEGTTPLTALATLGNHTARAGAIDFMI